MWQADFTHWRLADGGDIEILCWLDDHSRYALSVTAHQQGHRPHRGRHLHGTPWEAHGVPASTLTDNGLVFTTRLAGGRGGRNSFETLLDTLGVTQKNSRPNHPTTCGKVERFHQTLKRWLTAHPSGRHPRPSSKPCSTSSSTTTTSSDPHRHLGDRTPTAAYHARPKAITSSSHPRPLPRPPRPGQPRQRHPPRRRPTATTSASAATSTERRSSCSSTTSTSASSTPPPARSNRHLTIDPHPPLPRHRSPHRRTPTPHGPRKTNQPNPEAGSAVSDVLRHHTARSEGLEPPTF